MTKYTLYLQENSDREKSPARRAESSRVIGAQSPPASPRSTEILSPSYSTETLSPSYSTETLSPSYSTETLSPSYSTETLSPSYSTESLESQEAEGCGPDYATLKKAPSSETVQLNLKISALEEENLLMKVS